MFFVSNAERPGNRSQPGAAAGAAASPAAAAEEGAAAEGAGSTSEPGAGAGDGEGPESPGATTVSPSEDEGPSVEDIPPEELGTPDEVGDATVDLLMDPENPEAADDQYILESNDGSYKKSLTIKDDKKPGDKMVTLTFEGLKGGLAYTLTVDPGAEGKPFKVFRNAPFKKMIG